MAIKNMNELGANFMYYQNILLASIDLSQLYPSYFACLSAEKAISDEDLIAFYSLPQISSLIKPWAMRGVQLGVEYKRGEPFIIFMLGLLEGYSTLYEAEGYLNKAFQNPEYSDRTIGMIANHLQPLDKEIFIEDVLRLSFRRSDNLILHLLNRLAHITIECCDLAKDRSSHLQDAIKSRLEMNKNK
jgi:hypothetical protein